MVDAPKRSGSDGIGMLCASLTSTRSLPPKNRSLLVLVDHFSSEITGTQNVSGAQKYGNTCISQHSRYHHPELKISYRASLMATLGFVLRSHILLVCSFMRSTNPLRFTSTSNNVRQLPVDKAAYVSISASTDPFDHKQEMKKKRRKKQSNEGIGRRT
ncbi:hypothetical protein OPV22_022730 [Ensete ventricosum]|uniref:Uncharacterized protein n=1 Tax=Ensete ventricosum TaxID=4639 RepID=A0AAV8QQH5_ENSVE|nr:hypothetical protein OPV22_022730 [Ensete ventricosum]